MRGLMGLLTAAAPIAAGAIGGPLAGMAVGAGMGALQANERNNEMSERARRSRHAAADAIQASYARRDGKGTIPQIFDFNESESGNVMAGTVGGGMQGYQAGKTDWGNLFGSGGADKVNLLSESAPQLAGGVNLGKTSSTMRSDGTMGMDWLGMNKAQGPQASFANPTAQSGMNFNPSLGFDFNSVAMNYPKPRF